MKINKKNIGIGYPVYIIAELSANHNQDFELAVKTIQAMGKSGADAVKIQTYTPESITLNSDKPWFLTRKDSPWAGKKMYEIYEKGQTPWEWHPKLQKIANNLGMDFFSSPFDIESVDKLEILNVPAYKIASLEITDIPLIKKIAEQGKPIIISTGAATVDDIRLAVKTCYNAGNKQIALLKCTSAYPNPMEEVNLRLIPELKKAFNTVVGLSDHTLGIEVPIAAVALGAKIIEKHFILDKTINSLDKDFSLDFNEFKTMVKSVRNIEKALGNGTFQMTDRIKNATKYTRSLFAVKDIQKGEIFTKDNVKSLRPSLGLHPKYYFDIIGKKSMKFVGRGEPIELQSIAN